MNEILARDKHGDTWTWIPGRKLWRRIDPPNIELTHDQAASRYGITASRPEE